MKAIVLSGGGGRGSYQVGVWKALRKLNYDYKIVTGSSVGAINGLMMTQKSFYKSWFLWQRITFKKMYGVDFNESFYIEYAKNIIKSGGMETKELEKMLRKVYNKKRFFSSPINFGIVTFNVSKLKPYVLTKEEMKDKDVCKYVLASATCFPAFQMTDIDGDKYIDGGYYDYFPINLAISMGATEIVAVDLEAVGRRRKVKDDNINITYIKPNNKIANFLEFDKNKAKRDMKYGYNDTLKAFNIYSGKTYTFTNKINNGILQELSNINNELFKNTKIYSFKLSSYHKNMNSEEYIKKLFDDILEYLLKIFKFDDTKIYNEKVAKKLLKLIKREEKDSLEHSFNNVVLNMYNNLKEKKYKEISKNINSMYKEFTCALYLYLMLR